MNLDEAVEILNENEHRGSRLWWGLPDGVCCRDRTAYGHHPVENGIDWECAWLSRFEAIAIAEKYACGPEIKLYNPPDLEEVIESCERRDADKVLETSKVDTAWIGTAPPVFPSEARFSVDDIIFGGLPKFDPDSEDSRVNLSLKMGLPHVDPPPWRVKQWRDGEVVSTRTYWTEWSARNHIKDVARECFPGITFRQSLHLEKWMDGQYTIVAISMP